MLERDAFCTCPADIFERQPVQPLLRRDLDDFRDGSPGKPDVPKSELPSMGIPRKAFNRIISRVHVSGPDQVNAQKAALRHIEIFSRDILDHACPAYAAFDVNGIRAWRREFAVFDLYVADAAGGFAADAQTGKGAATQSAAAD